MHDNDDDRPENALVPSTPEQAAIPPVPETTWETSLMRTLSARRVPPEVETILRAPVDPDKVDIKPTTAGEVYLSQVEYRRILNNAFGPGGWALAPLGDWQIADKVVCREFGLVTNGQLISTAIGEQEYFPNNRSMTYATACEAAKSNAITRCCKDLGIASELWDKRWIDTFKKERCVSVWRTQSRTWAWRRRDASPFFDEPIEAQSPATPNTTSASPTSASAAPLPAPAPATPAPGGDMETEPLVDYIDHVDRTTGIKNGKAWTRFDIFMRGGAKTSTFDKNLADRAALFCENGHKARITFTRNGRYINLAGIEDDGHGDDLPELLATPEPGSGWDDEPPF